MEPGARIGFSELETTDLVVGAILEADAGGQIGGEPISRTLSVGNQGGIRSAGSAAQPNYIALFSKLDHVDWPDSIDRASGVLTYHGDNLSPQKGPLDVKGNQALHAAFRRGFTTEKDRMQSPPLFVFTKVEGPDVPSRSVRFEGIAVPGAVTLPEEDWFVAKWYRGTQGRYQNYLLTATVLDVPTVPRAWTIQLDNGVADGSACPEIYRHWIETGQRRSIGTIG